MCVAVVPSSVPCGAAFLPGQPCCLRTCHATACVNKAELCVVQGTLPPAHGKQLQLQALALKPDMSLREGRAAIGGQGWAAAAAGQQPQGVEQEKLAAAAAAPPAAEAGAGQQHWAVKKGQSAAAASAAAPAPGRLPVAVKVGWPPAAQLAPANRQWRLWEWEQQPAVGTAGKQPRAVKERQMLPAAGQQSPVDTQKGRETTVNGIRRHLCVHLRQGDFWYRSWEGSLAGKQVSTVL